MSLNSAHGEVYSIQLYVIKFVSDLSGQLYVATFDSGHFIELLIYMCWTGKIYLSWMFSILQIYKYFHSMFFFTKNVFSMLDTLQLITQFIFLCFRYLCQSNFDVPLWSGDHTKQDFHQTRTAKSFVQGDIHVSGGSVPVSRSNNDGFCIQ